jgi:hypothetical protein
MSALVRSIEFPPTRRRQPVTGGASLLGRILALIGGRPRPSLEPVRRPIDKPFPFFGD